jgi:hypothetical protein
VPERRNIRRSAAARPVGVAGAVMAIGLRLWAKAARHPVDSVAILSAGAASLLIIVNAVFLQSGPHRAPFVANPTSPTQAADSRHDVAVVAAPKPVEAPPARPLVSQHTPQPTAGRRNDPIGDLIGSSIGSSSRAGHPSE